MKKILLSVLLVVILPGCEPFSKTHPQMAEVWPVYEVSAGPQLNLPATIVPGKNPEVDLLIKNLYDTKVYAETLKIILSTHNSAATAHNKKVGQDLGIGQK